MVFLDPTFGVNGKVVTASGSLGLSLALQTDGKILVAGYGSNGSDDDFVIIRYGSNGTLDTSFDGDGTATTDFALDDDIGQSITLQADGKILAGGRALFGGDDDFAIARYNSNGSPDSSFDLNGELTEDFDLDNDEITGIRVQPDGKILAAGSANIIGDDDFAISRLNNDGTADSSFGMNGQVTLDFNGAEDDANDLVLQADGKILLVGNARIGGNQDFALARFNSNGTIDTSFGTDGKVTTDFAGLDDKILSAMVQADGKIVVAGSSRSAFGRDFALTRYNSNGTLDVAFGTGGKVTTDFAGFDDGAVSVHLQPDGKIVVTGTVGNSSNSDFGIARYNSNGTIDTSFGTNGKFVTDFGQGEIVSESVLQDGVLTLVGSTGSSPSNTNIALARYVLNQKPTDLSLSSLTIAENQSTGTVIGTLSTTDLDVGDSFTYSLVSGTGSTDNAAFEIVGNQLKTKQAFDFETKKDYSIRVKTTDTFGALLEKELKISVSDLAEPLPPPPVVSVFTPKQPNPTGEPIVGDRKNNRLPGTAQDDLIRGLQGDDKLNGKGGNDILVGGAGNDLLRGGAGDDVFRGGQGNDTFVLNGGFDRIQAFSDGQDQLKLVGGLSFANLTITQQGSDTLVRSGGTAIVLLTGVNSSLITAADFV